MHTKGGAVKWFKYRHRDGMADSVVQAGTLLQGAGVFLKCAIVLLAATPSTRGVAGLFLGVRDRQ